METEYQLPASKPNPSNFVGQNFGKLGVGVAKPDVKVNELDDHAVERMVSRGVSLPQMQKTVDEPLIVLQQTTDKFLYLSDENAVVITKDGYVITTYKASDFKADVKAVLDVVHRGGK